MHLWTTPFLSFETRKKEDEEDEVDPECIIEIENAGDDES